MNIAKNLERARLFFPDKPALVFEGKTYSYCQLDEDVNRLANGLRTLGVAKGDRVALFLPNIPEFILGYFAVQKIGAIAVSVNAMLKRHEVEYIVNDAGAKVLLTTASLRQEVVDEDLPDLKHVIITEGEAGNDLSFEGLMAKGDPHFKIVETDMQDPAAILYTSGTTGFPKGAVLTQMNIGSNSLSASNHSGVRPDDRLHLFLPLFHCFGQNYILNGGISKCATLVLHRRFEPEPVLEAIQKERVTLVLCRADRFYLFSQHGHLSLRPVQPALLLYRRGKHAPGDGTGLGRKIRHDHPRRIWADRVFSVFQLQS